MSLARSKELLLPGGMMALGDAIASVDWPEVVETPPPVAEGRYAHIMCRGVGKTPEEACAKWVEDVRVRLTEFPSSWLWWRQEPEIECQIDFGSDCLVWGVFSRMILSGAREA